ncbi:hypothetical protein I79_016777 [Cricetulus griseus]|uniref:Uncharacterized protein n=1 Tax=Cricetulus griseus TaxID=10029 RepID=G3I0A0_CRIGR|nr:hypothetical protein I79_016777 [Cricetulus griseus]
MKENFLPEELGSLEIVWRQSWSGRLQGFLLRFTVNCAFCYIQSNACVPDASISNDNKIEKNDDDRGKSEGQR